MLDFTWNSIDSQKSLDKITNGKLLQFSSERKIGFGKNDKKDYQKRLQFLIKSQKQPEEQKNEIEEQSIKDNNQDKEESKENKENKENTNKNLTEDDQLIKEKKATMIQNAYKNHKINKKMKEKLFVGFDQSQKYLIYIYVDKKIPENEEQNYDIESLFFKIYSFETGKFSYETKFIKDLMFNDTINISQIKDAIPDIIDKMFKTEEDDYDYEGFDEVHSEKGAIHDDKEESLSSIAKNDD